MLPVACSAGTAGPPAAVTVRLEASLPDAGAVRVLAERLQLRQLARSLRRARGFAFATILPLALGGGLAASLLGLFEPRSLAPPALVPRLRVEPIPPGDWGASWSRAAEMPEAAQTESLHALLAVLAALTLLALAVACSNVLVLLLSRATARRRETAVRAALGESRRALLGRLVIEAGILGGAGLLVALVLALAGTLLLRASLPAGLELLSVGGWARSLFPLALALPLLATLGMAVLLGLAVGEPARLQGALSTGGKATAGPHEAWLRNVLAVLQFAASLTLLTGAGLLVRNSSPLEGTAALGFDPASTLTLTVDLPAAAGEGERAAAHAAVSRVVRRVPGVIAESSATPGTWLGMGPRDNVFVYCGGCFRGGFVLPATLEFVGQHAVGPGFFRALGIPILRGREFQAGDEPGGDPVVVINRAFSWMVQFEGGNPVGKRIQVGGVGGPWYRIGGVGGPWYRIVGVAGDVHARGLGAAASPAPALYFSALQHPPRTVAVAVRTAGDSLALEAAVRRAIAGAAPGAAVGPASTLEAEIERFAAPLRWFGYLFAVLAAAALLLAVDGLYSTMRYHVSVRRREIGTRMALGARTRHVTALVVGQGARLTWRGALLGMFGALTLGRLLQLMFYGVRLFDPALFAALAVVLAGAGLLGSLLPARRAAGVDPVIALREE